MRKQGTRSGARVETMGLEPTTPCLQSRCSSQLSYVPGLARHWASERKSRGSRGATLAQLAVSG